MAIGLVWAQAANGVIGRDGALPWRLPEDMAHFKALTAGCAVVMGRATWESLPERFRPLPGRRNVVLSRTVRELPGAQVASSVDQALAGDDVWVIGGGEVYAACLPLAGRAVVTELAEEFAGDTYAPVLDATWVEDGPTPEWLVSTTGLRYRVRTWDRAE
ncbi:dihydrofolate reductase [Motilibacter aurantiacus]|uniref:dihydrofolate reductase n=1 Tax=Motilibacter aurantiacus TaxID=2714955 RepID=UPI00140A2B80|nr:dihydrofolate reductase [Motilibacter aurantiacus]